MNPVATHTELPDRVLDYLARALPDGGVTPDRVRLTQEGVMWRKPDGNALRFCATEEIWVASPAFTWDAHVRASRLLPRLHVVDGLAEGQGRLRVSVLGVPVARDSGENLTVGEVMRYLAELPWAPHAMLSPALRWHVVDETIVEVGTVAGPHASIGLRFDESGDVVAAFGHRPHREGKRTEMRSWTGLYSDYRQLGGIRVPTAAEVHWTLPDGPFTYFRGRVTGLELV